MEIIEINGVQYSKIEKDKPKTGKKSQMLAMAAMMYGGMFGSSYEPERPNVNIIEEFEKIQNKKSTLPKSQRDWVVNQFNRNYKII